MKRPSSTPRRCRATASWDGATWHSCSRMEGHDEYHLSMNGVTTWPIAQQGAPGWTAPYKTTKGSS